MEQLERAERYLIRMRAIYAGVFAQDHNTHDYEDDVLSFFMHCYHVRDWIVRLNRVGVTARDVDQFIDAKPCLRICTDLCNGAKHCRLTRPARSGSQPHVAGKQYSASTWLTGSGGGEVLQAKYTIVTSQGTIDALALAEECIECWRIYVGELAAKPMSGGTATEGEA